MSFRNPYNFEPLGSNVQRKKYEQIKHHECFDKGSHIGILTCILKTKTRIFTPSTLENDIQEDKKRHKTYNSFHYIEINGAKKYVIPASTLKGLFRSTAEAISNSCVHLFQKNYDGGAKYTIDKKYQKEQCVFVDDKGKKAEGICICCSMFGMANAKESSDSNEAEIQNVFKGKVRFTDGELFEEYNKHFENSRTLKILSNPKPYHKKFYADNDRIKGRKFYYHHQDKDMDKIDPSHLNRSITPLKSGARFEFKVCFENLTDEEYGLLLWTLELEEGLGHKIGMGKPLGLGSCVIKIKEIKEFTRERYFSIDNVKREEDKKLADRIEEIKQWWKSGIPNDLKCILSLNHGFDIRYPQKTPNEFNVPLHEPCKDFGNVHSASAIISNSAKQETATSKKTGDRSDDLKSTGRGDQMREAFKKAGIDRTKDKRR